MKNKRGLSTWIWILIILVIIGIGIGAYILLTGDSSSIPAVGSSPGIPSPPTLPS